jgi:hypothetical protein
VFHPWLILLTSGSTSSPVIPGEKLSVTFD